MTTQEYFCNLHDVECNQKYNKTLPYSFHLEMVYAQGKKFKRLIYTGDPLSAEDWQNVAIGLWGHDSNEDARLTYNGILDKFGKAAAEIIYCCTEERGRTRYERHSTFYFEELSQNRLAIFVKLCDIIANVKFSLLSNSSMFDKYKKEYLEVKKYLYREEFKDMFDYLEQLFTITQ
jgi:(p)ppGpp synthase/HD superfamily hydrolase